MDARARPSLRALPLALVAGGIGFYAGCVAYRAGSYALFASLTQGGIVVHVLGGGGEALVGLGAFGERAFASEAGMLAIGVVAGVVAGVLAALLGARRRGSRWRPAVALAALGCVAFAGDLAFGLTPWSEGGWRSRGLVARGIAPEHRLSVEEIRALPDALSGSVAETEGVLAYHDGLRRFHLASPEGDGAYVKVFFFERRRGGPSEMRGDGRPRYAERVTPYVGRRVRVVGRVVNGQIDVELSDVTPL